MVKRKLYFVVFIMGLFIITACNSKQSDINSTLNKDTIAVNKVKDTIAIKQSLTEEEALKRFNQHLNQNKKKYAEFGDIGNIQTSKGDYTGDGALEYFFEAICYPGGDYTYPEYFYYNSDSNKFYYLLKGKESDYINTYSFIKIEHNLITGSVNLFTAFSCIDYFTEDVIATFYIKDNHIVLNREYLNKLKQAEKMLIKKADEAMKKDIIKEEEYNFDL